MSITICLHHIKCIWICNELKLRILQEAASIRAQWHCSQGSVDAWFAWNSWLCTVHLPYLKICQPASSGKTCKRTRNHEVGGLRQRDILCNGDRFIGDAFYLSFCTPTLCLGQ
ncbi:uncharacterized protein LOC125515907 [Triticum urartu]|uniref:uncharacterized protein LOC125515907 n=1 Tax=Triticum urartu TaxID=4572 RepID=UPI0020438D88|nr:uncharacterized protein LOC125515907 [Triticum urartu]